MSRSGYSDDCDDILVHGRWRAQVASAIRGNRGQKFLKELAAAMDAMPEKTLITGELISKEGECCTMGVVCQSRGLAVTDVDENSPEEVGNLLGIAPQLAAEIAYENDECSDHLSHEERWMRMRKWVDDHLKKT
jgi:hypothetical protein